MIYQILTRNRHGQMTPDIGTGDNVFWSVEDAEQAIADLRALGADWADAEYSIEPVEWLTTDDAAELLGVSPGRVRQYVAEGRLPVTKFGNTNLIRPGDLAAFERNPPGRPRQAS